MEELTKAIIDLQSYGLNLRTVEKMVKDIYRSAEEAETKMKNINGRPARKPTK